MLRSLLALACLVVTQGMFWAFIYPMLVAAATWTKRRTTSEPFIRQWACSHAFDAVITFASLPGNHAGCDGWKNPAAAAPSANSRAILRDERPIGASLVAPANQLPTVRASQGHVPDVAWRSHRNRGLPQMNRITGRSAFLALLKDEGI